MLSDPAMNRMVLSSGCIHWLVREGWWHIYCTPPASMEKLQEENAAWQGVP